MICLFCRNDRPDSDEHPFATPLGEVRFVVRFVCKPCNDRLGSEVDALADRDAALSHARRSAGLSIRKQSVRSTEAAIEAGGKQLRTTFDQREQAAVVTPQKDGNEIVVGRDLMPQVIRDSLKAKFRKARQRPSKADVERFVTDTLNKFDAAHVGDTVRHSIRGVTITVPKFETVNPKTSVDRHDQPGAIERVSAKIALEIAADTLGVEGFLNDEYNDIRDWVLLGTPDEGRPRIDIVREPELSGGDAGLEHRVTLDMTDGGLVASIAYYNAYVIRVRLGGSVATSSPCTRTFMIEPDSRG